MAVDDLGGAEVLEPVEPEPDECPQAVAEDDCCVRATDEHEKSLQVARNSLLLLG